MAQVAPKFCWFRYLCPGRAYQFTVSRAIGSQALLSIVSYEGGISNTNVSNGLKPGVGDFGNGTPVLVYGNFFN